MYVSSFIPSVYRLLIVLQTCTRDALAAARPDYDRNWKAQKPDKFAKAYNAVRALSRCHLSCQ
jgi:hypothetical protein